MPNTVFLNKSGYIEQVYVGDQTSQTIKQSIDEVLKLVTKLKSEHKPVKIIASLEKLGKSSSESRSSSVQALKDLEYDKVSLYGGSLFSKHLANLIIRAAGKYKKVRVFTSRRDAEKWLRE